jgi:hypothetical protein
MLSPAHGKRRFDSRFVVSQCSFHLILIPSQAARTQRQFRAIGIIMPLMLRAT